MKNIHKALICSTIILLIILVAISITIYVQMPKRVCETTEEITKVELQPSDSYNFNKGDEVICEYGVTIYKYSLYIKNWNWDSEKSLTCLIKTKNEVCTIQ